MNAGNRVHDTEHATPDEMTEVLVDLQEALDADKADTIYSEGRVVVWSAFSGAWPVRMWYVFGWLFPAEFFRGPGRAAGA